MSVTSLFIVEAFLTLEGFVVTPVTRVGAGRCRVIKHSYCIASPNEYEA